MHKHPAGDSAQHLAVLSLVAALAYQAHLQARHEVRLPRGLLPIAMRQYPVMFRLDPKIPDDATTTGTMAWVLPTRWTTEVVAVRRATSEATDGIAASPADLVVQCRSGAATLWMRARMH